MFLAEKQRYDSGQGGGDDCHADGAEHPFAACILRCDVGLPVLCAGDRPRLRVPDPKSVDEEAVDEIHNGKDDEQLPEACEEAPCAVDGTDEEQHIRGENLSLIRRPFF